MQIHQLQNQGFVTLTYPPDLRDAVVKAVDSWKKFCELPAMIKEQLPYSNNADGVGYEMKRGVGNMADRKENFDVTTAGEGWLRERVGKLGSPEAEAFVADAVGLVACMKPTVLKFAKEAETFYGLTGFVDEVDQSEDAFFVRFIHYAGERRVGEETAVAHTDQSGFTFHLFESAPGLQCLTYDGIWINMPVSAGETVIIPSMQMQLRSAGKLTALCHRVIATDYTATHGRYSAVCFVQLKNTPKYDKEMHGRLQEKKAGFNYGMAPQDFAKLFKS